MEKLKYYTPDIEDIRVGYECELLIYYKWEPNTVKPYTALESVVKCIKNQVIRTPYLTKKQIEAEGWKVEWNDGNDGIEYVYYCKGEWKLSYSTGWEGKVNEILLIKGVPLYYRGEIKSINELRTICKLLNIC